MATTVTIDLRHVARGLGISLRQVQAVVELLDEGNTVPFITRYRKDRTGGLDEEQVRQVQARLAKVRLLADRKQTILRSIDAQGKLTDKLAKQILAAGTSKRLEDLYLPYKPKKQTLATVAHSRGLEPLAREIVEAAPTCAELDGRAAEFVSVDRQVPTAADALLGAGHILAELFSEQADLRHQLREILYRTGKFVVAGVEPGGKGQPAAAQPAPLPAEPPAQQAGESPAQQPADGAAETNQQQPQPEEPPVLSAKDAECPTDQLPAQPPAEQPAEPSAPADAEPLPAAATAAEAPSPTGQAAPTIPAAAPPKPQPKPRLDRRELKKKRAEEKKIKAFRGYFDYREELRRIPPHRLLAINRGERARVLRVKIESDTEAMHAVLDEVLVPPGHPHADYLRGCARDALHRLILPSLEREIRRELADRAELHAVEVFARNLRNLLLQPPVSDRRVLAVDPGYKNGCKLAALDQFGNVLDHAVVFLVGRPDRRWEARQKAVELIRRFGLSVVAIGNGTGCRECEDFFAKLLAEELQDLDLAYVIVNEAGASVYSTSRIGREEFPSYDASLRGAISIGRRLQDPLSELVKIDAANIGVGLYQHDVKARHLRESLDEVVESCVNYVGVEVNTASPALLRYVSGLNQLTARRVYEHRLQHGPFRSRQQLREVPGFGEATFVQATGFLKIAAGENPLDATWIHPESYEAATRVLASLDCTPQDLTNKEAATGLAERLRGVDADQMASQVQVGVLTLRDILAQLARPGRDPREDLPPPVFKKGVLKLEDLTPGMELTGTVLNVVDFGAFVDIGMHDSGLVHVSQLADRFVRDPHEVVAVGDVVKVWVIEVDKQRRRVSLTMVRPGTERSRGPRRGEKTPRPRGEKGPSAAAASPPPSATAGPPSSAPAQTRPPSGQPAAGDSTGQPVRGDSSRRSGRPKPDARRFAKGREAPGRRPPPRPKPRPKPPARPIIPITEGMKTGKEPLRTFGDLVQFYQHQQQQEDNGSDHDQGQKPKPDTPAARADAVAPPSEAQAPPPEPQHEGPAAAETPPSEPPPVQDNPPSEPPPVQDNPPTTPDAAEPKAPPPEAQHEGPAAAETPPPEPLPAQDNPPATPDAAEPGSNEPEHTPET